MGFDPNEPEQRQRLRAALKAADLKSGELWLNYFSIGGSVGEYEVEAYLQGLLSLPPLQRDLLAMAANELIEAVPRLFAPYSDDANLAQPDQESNTADDRDTQDSAGADEYTDPPENE
ncbi:hypothetical protein [Arthrobacter sp. 92]|uniref:hypothetical protein n=1 Tax=Arthrobacter sp. 92 TaxID=3418175 RepID=UPI003D04938D